MTRPARAHISLPALQHNYDVARQMHGGKTLAVIKANAYGHGALRCARALEDRADGFAVAFLDEARVLREAGITAPILMLEGVFDTAELEVAAQMNLWIVVHQLSQLQMIEQSHASLRLGKVWLKLDSGMHRAGLALQDVEGAFARLKAFPQVADVVLMTHFARADEPGHPLTRGQMEAFHTATQGLKVETSLCNSAGLLAWPDAHGDWARPGIMLYGTNPLTDSGMAVPDLRPVMTLSSQVFEERWLSTGESLGYGGRFTAQRPTRVGLVAIGYADGYPRAAGNGTPVAIDGQAGQIIGRVSMDMLTVDLTDLPGTGVGSEVELWGTRVSVDRVARHAGTIAYELLCNVKRVSFL
jgi:alanine racemase